MTGVSTTLRLVDQMTAPIMSIQHALNGMNNRFAELENSANIDSSSLTAMRNQIDMSDAAARELADNIQLVENNINQATQGQNGFNQSMRQSHSAADGLVNKLGAVVGAYASLQAVNKVLDLSDTMAQTTARLNLMNDGLQTTAELQDKIFLAAERSRASYQTTADVVSKLGMQAGNAFSSNDELIAFAEQLNKTFAIAGTDATGIESTMYNLTQALSSGVLRGQDLNAVFSNAQPIIQNIADYLGVTVGEIRAMAADGELSADVVKNAMLAAAEETNAAFEAIPMTFGQVMTSVKNHALMEFAPILNKLNEIANSPAFQTFVDNVINAISVLAGAAMEVFSWIIEISQFISDNWSKIEPIIWGIVAAIAAWKIITIAQTVYQWLLNAALLANPISMIVMVIGAIVTVIVLWINKMGGLKAAWLVVTNALLTAWDWVKIGFMAGVYRVLNLWDIMKLGMLTAGTAIANFMGDMKANVLMILQNMVNGAIGIINGFIDILNKIPGVNIGLIEQVTFGVDAQLANDAEKQAREANLTNARNEVEAAVTGRAEALDTMKSDALAATAERLAAIDEARAAAESAEEKDAGYQPSQFEEGGDISDNTASIAANTSKALDYSEEELKLWRDLAERDAIDKYTLVSVDMGGFTTNNNVSSEMDLDGIVNYIGDRVEETLFVIAEGVHA